jgi:hypothetical protein
MAAVVRPDWHRERLSYLEDRFKYAGPAVQAHIDADPQACRQNEMGETKASVHGMYGNIRSGCSRRCRGGKRGRQRPETRVSFGGRPE